MTTRRKTTSTNPIKRKPPKRGRPKAPKKTTIFLWLGAGLLTTAGAGYVIYRHLKAKKLSNLPIPNFPIPAAIPATTVVNKPKLPSLPRGNDGFPLRKGSKGQRVRQLQQALIKRHGASILPRFGADGDFGSETRNALLSKGFPTVIDAATFQRLMDTGSNTPPPIDHKAVANNLSRSIASRSFATTLTTLRQLRTVNDYVVVNNHFRNLRLGAVRYTLVTALFRFFPSERSTLITELKRIGLKHDSRADKWSLSGLDLSLAGDVVTKRATVIWDGNNTTVELPANIILGREITSENGFTRVRTRDDKDIFVHTNAVRYA